MYKHQIDFHSMTPHQLGDTYRIEALPYIYSYLDSGTDYERKAAALAIKKFRWKGYECHEALSFLIANLKNSVAQTRYHTLKTLLSWKNLSRYEDRIMEAAMVEQKEYNKKLFTKVINQTQNHDYCTIWQEALNRETEGFVWQRPDAATKLIVLKLCRMRHDEGVQPQLLLDLIEDELLASFPATEKRTPQQSVLF